MSDRPRKRLRTDSTHSTTTSRSHLMRRYHANRNVANLSRGNDAVSERETPKVPVASASEGSPTSHSPIADSACPQPQESEPAENSSDADSDSDSNEGLYRSAEEGSMGSIAMEDESTVNSSVHEDRDAMQVEYGDPEANQRASYGYADISLFVSVARAACKGWLEYSRVLTTTHLIQLSDVKSILNSFNGDGESGNEDCVFTLRQRIDELEGLALEALIKARQLKGKLDIKRTDAQLALLTRLEVFCETKLGEI
ncbi:hypothetical protein V5O48_003231 [Marasmius crinis-equi]|uniref:Uncharacterized protein n=1 Tax=Marasmius crinis-equi TaxID=585013 RepID=A0ABR3FTI4_9AGAR